MGRTTVDVRSAGPQDVGLLLGLSAAARAETGHEPKLDTHTHRPRIMAALERPDVEVLLAEVGAEPVGVLLLRRGELLPLAGTEAAHVEQLFVHPQWRRRGVARSLLLSAASLGEHAGLEKLVCSTAPADREAARFLARLGFSPLVTQRVVPVVGLLRRLAGESPTARRRSSIDQLLAKRRREQGKVATASTGVRSVIARTP